MQNAAQWESDYLRGDYETYSPGVGLGVEPGDQLRQQLATEAGNWLSNWISTLFDQHPRDKFRLEANYDAYLKALNGDCAALDYLRQRSGRFPPAPVTGYTGIDPDGNHPALSGWATATPREDAYSKYLKALPFCNRTPVPPPPGGGSSEAPGQTELAETVAKLMNNQPVGRDGLTWVRLGIISPTVVQQAYDLYGPALYAPGGALDPNQQGGIAGALMSNWGILAALALGLAFMKGRPSRST